VRVALFHKKLKQQEFGRPQSQLKKQRSVYPGSFSGSEPEWLPGTIIMAGDSIAIIEVNDKQIHQDLDHVRIR